MGEPLASRIRPDTLDAYVGQEHLVGKDKPIALAIKEQHLFSFLLWGPPGVGKTTLARIYAKALDAEFFELSAVNAGKADIKKVIEYNTWGRPKVLFLDEIHRFNKAQQDFLLPYVEKGRITLIGATTENPSFEVISPLLSRCRVFTLKPLTEAQMEQIIKRTGINLSDDAREWLVQYADGDARKALTLLDNTQSLYGKVTLENLQNSLSTRRYDKKGEEHYDTISAFIKSMRASQPNAAVYYLARMLDGGEDPKFIARRMIIFASEDVGLADPHALSIANSVFAAVDNVGMPEARIILSHGVLYLCNCKKDRRAYNAIEAALRDVKTYGNLAIPLNIRNAPTKLMKELGYGHGYQQYDDKSYLPEKIKDKKYV